MIATVITALIYILLLALVVYLVIWVLRDILSIPLPEKVIQIIWAIFALLVVLLLVQVFLGGGMSLPKLV